MVAEGFTTSDPGSRTIRTQRLNGLALFFGMPDWWAMRTGIFLE
jgi:hypothetical protein